MSILDQQVRRTHRRLTSNVMLRRAAWGVLVAAVAWGVIILVERLFVLGVPLGISAGLAAAFGLLITVIGTYRARVDQLSAAVVLDEATGLKERISTALTCRNDSDPFAQAAVHDAERLAGGVHVPKHVPYRAPSMWPWSVATLVAALILFQFMPTLDLLAAEEVRADDSQHEAALEARQEVEVALKRQVDRVKQRLEDKPGMEGLKNELAELELPDEPTRTPEDVRREAVKRIEKVADKLKERMDEGKLNALEQLKRELAKLETPKGDDASSKLAEALASGDMESARKAMGDLKKQLEEAAKTNDPATQAKVAEMKKKLDDLSKKLEQLGDQKKLAKDLQNKGRLSEEQAKKLLDKLKGMDQKQLAEAVKKALQDSGMTQKQIQEMAKKIAQNQQMQQQLKSMAQAMAQAAKACQQCQNASQGQQGAGQAMQSAMQSAMGQLSEMEMAEQMMNELEAQMAELEDLKAGVCEGNGQGNGKEGDPNNIGNQGPQAGRGYGARIGKQRGAHQYKKTKAKTRTKGGQIIGQFFVDGPQIKGESNAEATDAVNSALRDAEDAVERDDVPQQYHRVVQSYFDRLAGLMSKRDAAEREDAEGGDSESEQAADEAEEPK